MPKLYIRGEIRILLNTVHTSIFNNTSIFLNTSVEIYII